MYRTLTLFFFFLFVSFFVLAHVKQRKPTIIGQYDVSLPEDNSREIVLADLIIELEDRDNDEEEDDDNELMLSIDKGPDYSTSGNTITPKKNFSGTLSVPVQVKNGGEKSNKYNLQVQVTEVNDAPVITGQAALQTQEEQAITITLVDLMVSDPDNVYPDDFTLTVYSGTGYTVTGETIQPDPGFYGTLSVPVTVSDGVNTSNTFEVQIQVTNVNDPPTITGQQVLSMDEDGSLQISLSHLTVSDIDNNYPDGFTLSVGSGANYTVSGNTITAAADFSGTLTVPVSVNDGGSESNLFDLSVTVNAVNDLPVITGQSALSTNEETSLTIQLSNFLVTDSDNSFPNDFSLSVSDGSNYTVAGNTITPETNFTGSLTVPVTVTDGSGTSDPFNAQVTVNPVNDAPIITGQTDIQTPENESITILLNHVNVTDADNNYPSDFTLTIFGGSNYTFSGTTITPAHNFNGILSVPVTVSDGSATSNTFQLQVSVSSVNTIPIITGQSTLQTNEDQSITLALGNLTVSDSDNSYPSGFTMTAYAGENYTLSGLTVTPVANFSGTISVPVTVNDGSSESATFNLAISVIAQNDAPSITGQNALSTNEDTPLTLELMNLLVTDIDNTYPNGFLLNVNSGDNYTVQGTTVTPAANFTGTLSVPVTVADGLASSAVFNVSVGVLPVNDPPTITGQQALATPEDTPIAISLSHLTVTDVDSTYPTGFTLTILDGENYTVSGSTVTPVSDFTGILTVPVTVNDGSASSPSFNLAISVSGDNDSPIIIGQAALSTTEETPIALELSSLVVVDSDNTYPTGFTMSISPGENYTSEGNVITPATDFVGDLSVPVTVNDGTSTSNTFNVMISVVGSNDVPTITGQTAAITINEDTPFTFQLSNLTVNDTDNAFPTGFTFSLAAGDNYTISGSDIVPATNFYGTLTIPVVINDGINNSNSFDFVIAVSPVNDPPAIISHDPISIYKNKSIAMDLSQLQVVDPDNTYPDGFSLAVGAGDNYTVVDHLVTPDADYVGTLSVPVTVSDGQLLSESFTIAVEVLVPPNVKPIITGQVALTTYENEPLTLQLSHLVIVDPDNRFPDDFKLSIQSGEHYSLDGNNVVPETDFSGRLTVPVSVQDLESTSNTFNLKIDVLPIADVPLITSQTFLRINEDDSLDLTFSDLIVLDPDNNYPDGFTITALDGEHYSINRLQIKPDLDYNGYLSVPITVNDGTNTSAPYQLLILVDPVNDAPTISDGAESESMFYAIGKDPLPVFDKITLADVDDDSLAFAEIMLNAPLYQPGLDSLQINASENLRVVFDAGSGLLLLFGKAPVNEYQSMVQALQYAYSGQRNTLPGDSKTIDIKVSDGKTESLPHSRIITFASQALTLDVPSGFTPNGDGANDTWSIKGGSGNESFSNAVVRVYNKEGVLVFETRGFAQEWDGRLNGTLLPADVYFYTIDLHSDVTRNQYKGVITILR